jgi:AcrR family transcriptional regulator
MGMTSLKKTIKSTTDIEPIDPEMPLRDRKKATQRTNLLRVAYDLFRRDGFDQVRLEDIAFQANVSVPTLYNYFTNKRELLIGILMQDRADGAAAYEKAVNHPPADPCDALAELIYANVQIIRGPLDKRLWREICAAVALCHDRESDAFDRNHQSFKIYIKRLLQHFVGTKVLPSDYPVDMATDLIFAVNAHHVRLLAASESCTPEDIRDLTRAQMRLFLRPYLDAANTAGDRRPARESATTQKPKKAAATAKTTQLKGQARVQNKTRG